MRRFGGPTEFAPEIDFPIQCGRDESRFVGRVGSYRAQEGPDTGTPFDVDHGILIGPGEAQRRASLFDPADRNFDIAVVFQCRDYQVVENRIVKQLPPFQIDVDSGLIRIEPVFGRGLDFRRYEIRARGAA